MKLLKNKKQIISYLMSFVLIGAFLFVPINFCFAAEGGSVIAEFLSWIVYAIISFVGKACSALLWLMIKLFGVQKMDIDGVAIGWTLSRDVCNMFFILIFLIIAFATILRIENYSAKRLLPKLLMMAVLINFSKIICFLLIDFSNVVMLTFASAFTEAGYGNFVEMLGLQNLLKSADGAAKVTTWATFGALCLGLVFVCIAICIFIMFIAILVGRIIMFWLLIVLSPIAFMAYVIPGGRKYFDQWMSEFTRYLIIGPVLAFFTWLSLTVTAQGASDPFATFDSGAADTEGIRVADSGMGNWSNTMNFIVGVGLLIGTMKVTQSVGGIGAGVGMSLANKMKSKATNVGKSIGNGTVNLGKSAVKNSSKFVARNALTGAGALVGAKASEGSTRSKVANVFSQWGGDMKTRRKEEKTAKRRKVLEKLGMGDKASKALDESIDHMKKSDNVKGLRFGGGIAGGAATGAAIGSVVPVVGTAVGGLLGGIAGGLLGGRNKIGEYVRQKINPNRKELSDSKNELNDAEKEKEEKQKDWDEVHTKDSRFETIEKNRRRDLDANEKSRESSMKSRKEQIIKDAKVNGWSESIVQHELDEAKKENDDIHNKRAETINNRNDKYKEDHENTAYGKQKQELTDADDRYKNAKARYEMAGNAVDSGQINIDASLWRRTLDKMAKGNEDHNPYFFVQEAAKQMSKDSAEAGVKAEDLASASPEELAKTSFRGVGGSSEKDKKVFDLLNSGAKKWTGSIDKMIDNLEQLRKSGTAFNEIQQKNIYSMKRWMADRLDDGKTLSSDMMKLKNTLDQTPTPLAAKNNKDKDKVDELRKST